MLLGRTPHIRPLGVEGPHDLAAVHDALGRLDLLDLADRVVATLSGGERQRVLIARALAQGAPIVLLDEPTTALDVGHQQQVLELVDDLRREHDLTVVTTMHDLTLAGQYAERLVLLDGGRVVVDGPGRRGAHRGEPGQLLRRAGAHHPRRRPPGRPPHPRASSHDRSS